jgi:O-methyltransferase involved in polyketide biosynthesis
MSQIKDVSGTAFVVAEFRAEENRAATPLYHDAVVGLFLSEDSRRAADLVEASFPPVKDMVKIRTKYFDDMLERQLQACYEAEGIDADVTFIPGNYVTDGLIDLLKQSRFDFDLPTYVIWEGNTMYLPLESVKHTMAELRRCVQRFRLSFDYMAEAVIARTTGDPGITSLVESFAAMGAPWVSGIRDIRHLAREMRLQIVDNFKTADLGRAYGLTRPVTSPIFGFYSVCTLGF